MLTSISLLLLLGLSLGAIFNKFRLPSLIGYILTGMILGPYLLNVLDPKLLNISAELREIALVIILTRAGLSLNLKDLKKVGISAILMCFLPATLEIIGIILLGTSILGMTILDAAILGSVIAAVSPAVVVPRMINLIEKKWGTKKAIPQLIVAGAAVDDVFVIVLFTAFVSLSSNGDVSIKSFITIPISIILGIILGVLVGYSLIIFLKKVHMRDSIKLLILLSISFLLLEIEDLLAPYIAISALLAIMSVGIIINQKYSQLAKRISIKYNKLWIGAEILLFVLVGAIVNIQYLLKAGILSILVLLGAMVFRMIGVLLCITKTNLNKKERLFCMLAYTPKATVQAAIGAIPLTMGLACGEQVLIIAVLSILLTAPFGAICVDTLYKKLLTHDDNY